MAGHGIKCTTDCVIDRLDVEFKGADDGSLLDVAQVLVAPVHHLAVYSFVRLREGGLRLRVIEPSTR